MIDGLLPEWILTALSAKLPEIYRPIKRGDRYSGCTRIAGDGNPNYCIYLKDREEKKSALDRESAMPPLAVMIFRALKSIEFTQFLHKLSGLEPVRSLIADPMYNGSGVHFVGPEGKLGLHADFNTYRGYGLERRVNTFLFLNHDWPDRFGGHLEFWNRNLTRCEQRLRPAWNRFVVFSTTDYSWHGHPQRMEFLPQNRMRRSLALYYYTRGRPIDECKDRVCGGHHGTIFVAPKTCRECLSKACKAFPTNRSTVSRSAWLEHGGSLRGSD